MMRRTRLLRLLSVVWAGLQLAAPAIGSLADARLAAASGDAVAHVESTTSTTCPVFHAPDCAICRYLSGTAPLPDAPVAVAPIIEGARGVVGSNTGTSAFALVLPDGRAPPTV